MAEKIAFETGSISNCQELVTLILDWVILRTKVHHSSTSTCAKFHWNQRNICGWTYVCTYGRL